MSVVSAWCLIALSLFDVICASRIPGSHTFSDVGEITCLAVNFVNDYLELIYCGVVFRFLENAA